jgi:metallophosphoesterase superfamily enzyme
MKAFVRLVSLDVFVCFRSSDIAIAENKPIFVVSDLHIGVGKRNSFAMSNRERLFSNFLDHIEKEAAKLVIVGDFLELWHSRIEPVL